MGISEIISAVGAAGIASLIFALIKLLQFFKESNKDKVEGIVSRLDVDNQRWYNRYTEIEKRYSKTQEQIADYRVLVAQYRAELLKMGVPEEKVMEIEKEHNNRDEP